MHVFRIFGFYEAFQGVGMAIERLFVFRWWGAASLLCLLLLVAAGGWFYHAEAISAEEKASQQLAVLARIEASLFKAGRQRLMADGANLFGDSLFTAAAVAFFENRRGNEILSSRLYPLMEQNGYGTILVVDTAGVIHLQLGRAETVSPRLRQAITRAVTNFQPVLIEPWAEAADALATTGVVAPIISIDHHQDHPLGAVVLLVKAGRLHQAMFETAQGSDDGPRICLVQRDAHGMPMIQTNSPNHHGSKWQTLAEHSRDSLIGLAVADQVGLARGRDHQGEQSLGFIVRLPESAGWLIVSEPAERIFSLWRYRAAVLLFIFAGGVGLVSLLWQCGRKTYYKSLYASESRLRRNLEHQAILLQGIGDGIIATGPTGLIELFNPVAEQLTGWSRDEALGRPLGDVFIVVEGFAPEGPPATSGNGGQLGANTAIGPTHHLLLDRNGRERIIAALSVPLANEQGEFVGAILTFQDQSEEYQTRQWMETRLLLREYAYTHGIRELLHRATQELAVLLESPKGFCCCPHSPSGAVAVEKRVAPGMANPWSWDDGEGEPICAGIDGWLDDLPGEAIIHDPSLGDKNRADAATCRFGTVREMLLPLWGVGRRVALLAVADKPRPYSSRDMATMVQMGEYIWRLMEQKLIEEDLLASERRYRTLYRSMMDAFVVVDLRGNIRECNQAYAAMLGFTLEEVKGRSVIEFTPERWLKYEQEHVRRQLMHGGCSELYEKEYRHRDGTLFPVELQTFLLVDNEGQPEGMSAVVRDITRRKQEEQEREKLRARLNQAQRLESVGQLAGGVAHDFNNMLSVIIGYAELALRRMEVPEPLDKYLQEIIRAGKRSAEVTRQLLAFARKQTISPRLLDLNGTLEGMLKMLRRLIGEDIELFWLPDKDIWPVRMDPSQIDQLLANLCVNARDAIRGVGKITIETGRVSFDEAYCSEREGFIPGDFVVLAVSDNGCGIDRDILDKIFEPFFTTKAVGQGTGLGLATVYGIVKQNNGFINVYSEPGHGTTFRIYLPRQEGEAEIIQPKDNQPLPFGNGEIILVVEDEVSMLALNRTMLEQLNYTVLTAATPQEALRLAREYGQPIALVLIDVIMPEMNGRDLSRAISECCPSAKVLFMSGYTANIIAHRGELEQGVQFISKPFTTGELAAKIRETLRG
jgi:PAS domain S-box-containing protein